MHIPDYMTHDQAGVVVDFLAFTVCEVVFIKDNGEKRVMKCTRNENIINLMSANGVFSFVKSPNRWQHDFTILGTITAFDIENRGWRSFKLERVLQFTPYSGVFQEQWQN